MKISLEKTLINFCAFSVLLPSLSHASPTPSLIKRAFDYGTSDIINTFKSDKKKGEQKRPDTPAQELPIEDSLCSAHHPLTNGFYDLSDLSSIDKDSLIAWNARGYDYSSNFTLGVCSSPLKPNVDIKNNYHGLGGEKIN